MAVGIPQRGPSRSPAWPPTSAAPCRLHHDSQWCWAGRARWLETQRNTRTDGASTDNVPWPAPAPPPTHAGLRPEGGPPAALAQSVQGKGNREGRRGGRGSWGGCGGDGHQEPERKRRTGAANPFSCPLLALEGLPGARWWSWPPGWAWRAGAWRPPPWRRRWWWRAPGRVGAGGPLLPSGPRPQGRLPSGPRHSCQTHSPAWGRRGRSTAGRGR